MKLGEAVKNYLADFFPLRGGVPPLSANGFWQDDFPLRGGGTPKKLLGDFESLPQKNS